MSKAEAGVRERMVRTAARLFREQGYAATGLKQIVEESRTPKGSVYFYFPEGKEQLAAEALRYGGARLTDVFRALAVTHLDPAAALDACVRYLADDLERSGFRAGCPIGTVTLEAAATSDTIRAAVAPVFDAWRAVLATHLVRAGFEPAAAAARATLILAAVEGALILCRAARDTRTLHEVNAQLAPLLHP